MLGIDEENNMKVKVSFSDVAGEYDLNDDEYNKFIKGESLQVNLSNHYYQVTYKGFPLAYGKCSNNELKNKYPKGLRRVV